MASAKTPFPLGVFVGGPNGSDPTAQAAITAQYNSFVSTMGAAPQFMDGYIDQSQSISQWVSNASWTAWSWAQMPGGSQITPVIGLPMATNADAGSPDAVFKAFASGQYDSVLSGMVQAWAAQGFSTQYWRPGYEMNVPSMPWYVGSNSQTQADYVSAFQHISSVLHSAGQADGVNVQVVWSPNVQNWNGDVNVQSLYPGNQAVDVVGPDEYDNMYPRDLYDWDKNNGTVDTSFQQWAADPVNIQHYFAYPSASQYAPTGDGQGNGMSLQDFIDLAKANGKPIALSETGAGGGNTGIADDPAFVQALATTLQNAGVPVSFVNIWDTNDNGDWNFSSANAGKPQEAAAWQQYFGAGATGTTPPPPGGGTVPPPAPVTIGSGPDSITIGLSEDAWQGDAQVTLSVDGKQIGGTQIVTALHGSGQSQNFVLQGSFGAGPHTVAVDFLNDAWGGTTNADRNVYVNSITANGSTIQENAALMSAGTQNFTVPGTSTASPTAPVTIGAGPDSITVNLSEDAWQGNAQVLISVNGQQIGGTQTVTALHGSGQSQNFVLQGAFGSGSQTVAVNFLNDAYGGSSTTDRNVYVNSITANGSTVQENAGLMSAGTQNFTMPAASTATPTAPVTVGSGPNSITLNLSEDAWQGDAQVTLSVDGKQIGGTQTVTALHGSGQSQNFVLQGSFSSGQHSIAVDFLNDAFGGTVGTDRNVYVNSITANGSTTQENAALMSAGTQTFTVAPISSVSVSSASGPGAAAFATTFTTPAPAGNATLSASGSELFDFTGSSFGHDVITGFDPSSDVIKLGAGVVSSFSAVQADLSASAGNAVLTLDGSHSITLQGVAPTSLHAANFSFG